MGTNTATIKTLSHKVSPTTLTMVGLLPSHRQHIIPLVQSPTMAHRIIRMAIPMDTTVIPMATTATRMVSA